MNKVLICLILAMLSFTSPSVLMGQIEIKPVNKFQQDIPVLAFQQPNLTVVHLEDIERDKNGEFYRIAIGTEVNITPQNSGIWSTETNGDRVWRLKVKYPGAEALNFLFSKFRLYGNSTIDVYDENGKRLHPTYTAKNVLDHGQQNLSLCAGDYMMLELVEPAGTPPSVLEMENIFYCYRGTGYQKVTEKDFGDSESCQVNVNCSPEGNNWQNQKRGVARILVYMSASSGGWCTGSLVNNLRQDCTPYFLTAYHCGGDVSQTWMNYWNFYFNYESSGCSNPGSEGTLANRVITGCVKIADSNDGGENSSDLLLLHLGSVANANNTINTLKSANFNAYWNGWDANNAATTGGVGIHHPAGDIKKISTFTGTTITSGFNSTNPTHWRVTWSTTANGFGVTEGGSSGSPLFNNSHGRIIGTLTGGLSACTTGGAGPGTGPTQGDVYGKMSYHWTSNGATDARRLKPWLDPENTGILTLDGSLDPCSASGGAPNANFTANQTNVTPGTTVSFTDQTTGSPNSWSWSVSPGTGWTYTGGTSATSQHPQVIFNNVGTYTVSLTATNANGSDTETKTNYIVVATSSGPCAATSQNCDEYIAQVQLNTINNSSGCNNYIDYSSISTTLVKGQQYTITIIPGTLAQGPGGAYTGNQIAAWIDFNNDDDFVDAGEQIGMGTVGSGFNGTFTFTVPAGAATGTVRMRVRIIYPASGMTTIQPCGTNQDGEVEDYRVILSASSDPGVGLEENTLNAISIYPNPISDEVTIDLNSNFQLAVVSVLDITGKEVLASVNSNVESVRLDMSALSSGVYQVVINTEYGKAVKRVFKR